MFISNKVIMFYFRLSGRTLTPSERFIDGYPRVVHVMSDPTGVWYIQLENGDEHEFYHGCEDENPLETVDEFDVGDNWSMDIPELQGERPEDPEDNSFVLIPKDAVADVFFRPYGSEEGRMEPVEIDVMSGDEFVEDVLGGELSDN